MSILALKISLSWQRTRFRFTLTDPRVHRILVFVKKYRKLDFNFMDKLQAQLGVIFQCI